MAKPAAGSRIILENKLMKLYRKLRDIEISRQFLGGNLIEYYLRVTMTSIIKKYFVKMQYPYHSIASVNIETTGYCNRKCYFCFFHDRFPKRKQGIMEETTYKNIIDELSKINFCGRLSPHSYGEPLLDKRLPALMEYTKKKLPNCYTQIMTNGDFLTAQLFKQLIAKGVDHFIITNYDDEEKAFLTFISEHCPWHVRVRSYKDFITVDRAGKILNRKSQLHEPCLRPSSQLVINWKGDVILCCNDFYGEYVMGNVNDGNLLDIWNSAKFDYYRNNLIKGQRSSIPICHHCDIEGGIPW